jgi:SAM-dependent methyltransferase
MNTARKMAASEPAASREEARIGEAYERRKASGKSYSWFDAGHLFIVQELEARLLATLLQAGMAPLDSKQILEVGCGNGHWLREFIKWGARPENLAGIDLLPGRIAQACRLSPPGVRLTQGSASQLDFADDSFDIVFQATVFTSILDGAVKVQVAREMIRVLKPDGVALWYDFRFNNPRNRDVRGIKRAEIERLFPGCRITLERVTLAPPLARALAPYSRLGAYLLGSIPWARSHYLGAIHKPR